MPKVYVSTYCGKAHNLEDGYPIGHSCEILPVAFLQAEREGRIEDAAKIIQEAAPLPQLKQDKRIARIRLVRTASPTPRRYARP
jgi:hypothetical protein